MIYKVTQMNAILDNELSKTKSEMEETGKDR